MTDNKLIRYEEEKKIRELERSRAVSIINKYNDGSYGAFMNMKENIYRGN